jgi:hypothetical protein
MRLFFLEPKPQQSARGFVFTIIWATTQTKIKRRAGAVIVGDSGFVSAFY